MADLKYKVAHGAFFKMGAQATFALLRVGSLMALARLLSPRDFGLVGMVTVVTGIFGLFQDAGLSLVTVQRPHITKEQISTLFWVNIFVGGMLSLALLLSARLIASFYREPRLVSIAAVLAIGFLINAAGVQHAALLQREMRFITLSLIQVLSNLVSYIIAIGMALGGFGYWSLVAMSLMPTILTTASVWIKGAWIPGRPRQGVGVRSMLGFGSRVTINGAILYASFNIDKVLVGRYWGTEALGIYGRAYQIVSIPNDNLNSAVGQVTISALARVQDNPNAFKGYFLKGLFFLMSITLPITASIALYADEIILFFLGPAWKDAAIILRLLAPTILAIGIFHPFRWFLYASGRIQRSLNITLVHAPLIITAYFVGLPHGPRGVALSYSTFMILWIIPIVAWSVHGTMVSMKDIIIVASKPIISTAVAATCAFIFRQYLGVLLASMGRLLVGVAILMTVYALMLLLVFRQKGIFLDVFKLLRQRDFAPKGALSGH